MKKRICSILLIFLLLANTGLCFAINDSDIQYQPVVIEAEYIGVIDGRETYCATIPFNMEYTDADVSNTTRAVNGCQVFAGYCGNGVWAVDVMFREIGGLLTYINGTCTTYGDVGATSPKTLYGSNLVPGSIIYSETVEFHYLHPYAPNLTQYFEVQGSVTAVNGAGWFGPTTIAVTVP
jgi:hypothetical protein